MPEKRITSARLVILLTITACAIIHIHAAPLNAGLVGNGVDVASPEIPAHLISRSILDDQHAGEKMRGKRSRRNSYGRPPGTLPPKGAIANFAPGFNVYREIMVKDEHLTVCDNLVLEIP